MDNTAQPRGVWPVLETPFRSDESVDEDSFVKLVDHVIATGVDGVMFPGFASEFLKLDKEERRRLSKLTVAQVRTSHSSARVMLSISEHSTSLACQAAEEAVILGADALNILPPYQMAPIIESVVSHLDQILRVVPGVPVVIQFAPRETGSALAVTHLDRLAEKHGNLVAVKVESSPPQAWIRALTELSRPLGSLVGYAGLFLPQALTAGATGVQPGSSFTEVYVALWRAWCSGDHESFERLFGRLVPHLVAWMTDVEYIVAVEKEISRRRGLIATARCRQPCRQLDAQASAEIDRFLDAFDELLQAAPSVG